MKSEELQAKQTQALEWYATMGIDADLAPRGMIRKNHQETKLPEAQRQSLLVKSPQPSTTSLDFLPNPFMVEDLEENRSAESEVYLNVHEDSSTASTLKSSAEMGLERSLLNRFTDLASLHQAVLAFEGCSLKATATNTVFADGVPTSKIMLIGEAPGATEDAKGIPFCGESGKLLDNMIASIGLLREKNVYITNTIFWRPPGNRAPTDQEIAACRPFVEQHIALINPDLLILVGSTAVTSLLGKHLQISKIRQEYYQYTNKYLDKNITTTALFHPAYLLRQPMQKKTTWYDLLKIKEFIGKNIKEVVF